MSRVGRKPIELPEGVEISAINGDVKVSGSKGSLALTVSAALEVSQKDRVITLERSSEHRNDRANHGLARSLIANAVIGVSEGFSRNLEIHGVG